MASKKLQIFKRLLGEKSGNAVLLTALGMPVLIGAAGYAMDMAQMYAWKRELQQAVDQGALAGAWTLAYDKTSQDYSTRAEQEYDSNLAITKTFADSDSTIQLGSYGGGTNNSVIVSARATKELPFTGFIVGKAMTVFATAQATYAEGGTYQACLMALKKNVDQTFVVGGSATVNASCGLGALSCEDDAIKITVDPNDPTKKGVTTDSIVACGTVDVPTYLESKVTEGATGLSNPFENLPTPTSTDNTNRSVNCPNGGSATSTTTYLSPGVYSGMNMNCKIVMNPGIYVVNGGVLDMTDQKSNITGNGVMFVLKNGAQLKLGGSGNAGSVNLTPMEAADFVGTPNEPYKNLYGGMLIYEEKGSQTSAVSHAFNGNANITVRGTFYMPNGDLTVNGGSSAAPLCFQLWASTLSISGNTSITTTCTSTQTNSAGSSAGGVRLVA
ncbi:pilus assembly protein [Altererythrobacter salegens]|uniref:Pilus assembly protein n=1 Tax=Croceibacterium salegens TaxID=1737568 RepID=A0A6I4SUT7_9SPHN|nr:TadE/TadG family type IV pilus assembly protein [Croceibacterium salegens]MXO59633.1 pilus assembly protein [Croceibacterium salegens]